MNKNLDKVWDVWHNLDNSYEALKKAGKTKSKKSFLLTITSDSEITKLRNAVMSDFEENDESMQKINLLFEKITDAKQRVTEVTQIDNLVEFVWEYDDSIIDLQQFSISEKTPKFDQESVIPTISFNEAGTGFKIGIPSENIIYFRNGTTALAFLAMDNDDENSEAMKAYIYNAIVTRSRITKIPFFTKLPDSLDVVEVKDAKRFYFNPETNKVGEGSGAAEYSYTNIIYTDSSGAQAEGVVLEGRQHG